MISKDDRIAFSLRIVSADETILGLNRAKVPLLSALDKAQKLDNANKNLLDPVNALVTGYHSEIELLDGLQRFNVVEQDIQDSANRVIRNHFYPNDTSISVPSLAPYLNVWTKTTPFALTYAIGKNYQEANPTIQKEADIINDILSLITTASTHTDMENTTGQHLVSVTVPTPATTIEPFPAVITLKDDITDAVNDLIAFVTNEETKVVTSDTDSGRQALNDIAINYINNILLPALNQWAAYPDFHYPATFPLPTITVGNFNSYNTNLLAPTKLHLTELTALQTLLNNRLTYLTTRISEVYTFLGGLTQDLSTGLILTRSGLYSTRFGYIDLRLNLFSGSAIEVANISTSLGAQTGVQTALEVQKETYFNILPTSIFKSSGNNTDKISIMDPSFLSVGDEVYIYAEDQEELRRAVKSISGDLITLNDIVPAKYRPSDKARLYKDIS